MFWFDLWTNQYASWVTNQIFSTMAAYINYFIYPRVASFRAKIIHTFNVFGRLSNMTTQRKFSCVVAVAEGGGIGKNNTLPWRLK